MTAHDPCWGPDDSMAWRVLLVQNLSGPDLLAALEAADRNAL